MRRRQAIDARALAGQMEAFRTKVKIGDLVALPLKSAPAVAFGRITGDYRYVESAVGALRHQRSVEWINDGVPRDAIDQDLLYSLGAFLTVCRTKRNNAEHRIRAMLAARQSTLLPESHPTDSTSVVEPDEVAESAVDLGQLGRDQIRRRLAERFKGHELARLIGDLLRAEGFVCDISPPGPDGGVDILAGQGGMGVKGGAVLGQLAVTIDDPPRRVFVAIRAGEIRLLGCSQAVNGLAEGVGANSQASHSFT